MIYKIKNTIRGERLFDITEKCLDYNDYQIFPVIENKRLIRVFNKYTFIDKNDTKILDNQTWYDFASYYNRGIALICINSKYNFINYNGNLLFQNCWFDDLYDSGQKYMRASINKKWGIIDIKGNILTDFIFERVKISLDQDQIIGLVTLYGKQYKINNKIELE